MHANDSIIEKVEVPQKSLWFQCVIKNTDSYSILVKNKMEYIGKFTTQSIII